MDEKLNALQQILDNLTEDSGFFGSIISSEEGLIILSTNRMDPTMEIEALAAKAATIFNEYEESSSMPQDITINYPSKKIFIQKVSSFNNSGNSVLLITLMPQNLRYFRRKVNRLVKHTYSIIS